MSMIKMLLQMKLSVKDLYTYQIIPKEVFLTNRLNLNIKIKWLEQFNWKYKFSLQNNSKNKHNNKLLLKMILKYKTQLLAKKQTKRLAPIILLPQNSKLHLCLLSLQEILKKSKMDPYVKLTYGKNIWKSK